MVTKSALVSSMYAILHWFLLEKTQRSWKENPLPECHQFQILVLHTNI